VDIMFVVDPGKRAYVNRINYRGNTKTEDEVLRREMRQMEGGWASTYLIDQSKTRLERLGFFKEVNVETPPVPGTDDQVDVNYSVEEQASGSITASVGFAQSAGLILGG
ncbi:POTRA domain-containing protein, partial [Pseudomonas sp. BR1R-5]